MNPRPTLTPAARALRTEIVCRYSTLFTHSAAYRDLNPGAPLTVDPCGDAAHLIGRLRAEADTPADADALLARVAASIPGHVLEEPGVDADGLAAALRAASPARPIYEW